MFVCGQSLFWPAGHIGTNTPNLYPLAGDDRPLIGRDYHQSFVQPDFGAGKKKALSGSFLLIFLCLRPKRAPKNLRETLVASDTRVSLVKVLPNLTLLKRGSANSVVGLELAEFE